MLKVFFFLSIFVLLPKGRGSGSAPIFTFGSFPNALDMPVCDNKLVYYKISVETSEVAAVRHVLDVRDGYLPPGAGIQMWELTGTSNQVFYALRLDKEANYFYLRTLLNHLCVEATIPLSTAICNGINLYQRWQVENSPSSSLCSKKQESFLVGRIKNGNSCLGYGTYVANTHNFTRSLAPPANWNEVGIIPCLTAPSWRLHCMSNDIQSQD